MRCSWCRPGPMDAVGAVDAQTAPTAPWKTLRVFHNLPQGIPSTKSPTDRLNHPQILRRSLFEEYVGPPDSFLDVLPILTPDYRLEIVVRDREVAVHSNTNRPQVVRARFSDFKPEAQELALSPRCAWHKVQICPTKEVLMEAIECRFTLRGEPFGVKPILS